MDFSVQQTISHPSDKALIVLRDKLDDLPPYLPNVETIETVERKELEDGRIYFLRKWRGKAEIPKVAQKFISPETFQWFDHAWWNQENLTCEWKLESIKVKGLFTCDGKNMLIPQGDHCDLHLAGNITIQVDKLLPPLMRGMSRAILSQLETLVIRTLRPNMEATASAVQTYLDEHERKL